MREFQYQFISNILRKEFYGSFSKFIVYSGYEQFILDTVLRDLTKIRRIFSNTSNVNRKFYIFCDYKFQLLLIGII